MTWASGMGKCRLLHRDADYRELRGANALMVWGDLPYWMVVDHEMEHLLRSLDGQRTLDDAIAQVGASEQRAMIRKLAKRWVACGILADVADSIRNEAKPAQVQIESVAINLTQRCNLRCRFCYNLQKLSTSADGELSEMEFCAFINSVRPHCSRHRSLFVLGGEPFLDVAKLLGVARRAVRCGFAVVVSTNGLCIQPATARALAKLGAQVQVSLDGASASIHEAIRGQGSFAKAVDGIRILVAEGVHAVISMVAHADNVQELESFYDLAISLGVKEARFIPLKCVGGASECELRPVPMTELMRRSRELFTIHPQYRRLAGRDAFSILAGICRLSGARVSCGTGRRTVLLDADGTLYPCLNTNRPELAIANVRDAGYRFEAAWRQSPVLARVRRQSEVAEGGCGQCPVRRWCLGGCRGETLAMTDRMDRPSPHCRELRRATLDMMWTLAENPELTAPAQLHC